MASIFRAIPEAPVIEVFALSEACKTDGDPDKVNLTVGAYRTNNGKPWVLPCVRSVEAMLANDITLDKEYLPITGLDSFCTHSLKLLLGEESPLITQRKADGCQALGGTGALFLSLAFLHKFFKSGVVYVSRPTWPNHKGITKFVGLELREYTYWDSENRTVDFENMKKDFHDAPEGAFIVLHACAHNPTGMDLTQQQWKELVPIFKERKLVPVFDIAYQGFATGDLDADAWAVRHFASECVEMFVAQSFSKNFGLYNERVGNLVIITNEAAVTAHVKSQIKIIIRQSWSNPPQHGARIVATVLSSPTLMHEWKSDVSQMSERIKEMRRSLYEKLQSLNTPGTWDHIVKQIGMFSYTGLTKKHAEYLREKHHIYIMNDGRVNMCGITTHNVDHVAFAIHDTLSKLPE